MRKVFNFAVQTNLHNILNIIYVILFPNVLFNNQVNQF